MSILKTIIYLNWVAAVFLLMITLSGCNTVVEEKESIISTRYSVVYREAKQFCDLGDRAYTKPKLLCVDLYMRHNYPIEVKGAVH